MSKMANLMNSVALKNIEFDEISDDIPTRRKAMEIIKFAIDYLKTFNDPFVTKALAEIYKMSYAKNYELTIILKRKIAILFLEIYNPENHIIKYWKTLTTLEFITNTDKILIIKTDEFKKFKSFLEFYKNYGYLTKNQIGLIDIVKYKNSPHLYRHKFINLLDHTYKLKTITIIKNKLNSSVNIKPDMLNLIIKEWTDFNKFFFNRTTITSNNAEIIIEEEKKEEQEKKNRSI